VPDGHLLVHAGDVSLVRETHPDARGWDGVGWVLKLEAGWLVRMPAAMRTVQGVDLDASSVRSTL